MSATMPPNTAAGFPSLAKKIWIFAIIRGVLRDHLRPHRLVLPDRHRTRPGHRDRRLRHRQRRLRHHRGDPASRVVLDGAPHRAGRRQHPVRDPCSRLAGHQPCNPRDHGRHLGHHHRHPPNRVIGSDIGPFPTADGSGASSAARCLSSLGSWCSSGPASAWSASSGSSASGPLSGASPLSSWASNSARPPAPPRPVLRRPLESDSASRLSGQAHDRLDQPPQVWACPAGSAPPITKSP